MDRTLSLFLVTALTGLLGATAARADTTEQDLAKYWRLRQRLVTDFASVGPGAGQSQPSPERNDVTGQMHWGDGTIALGFYLGVLATEHALLAQPGRFPGADEGNPARVAQNLDELYHALLAMERLDRVADASFPSPCTTNESLNGFFLRDDVPADLYLKFPGITTVTSDFQADPLTNKEMSQDQVYHVQTGLALVARLVAPSVTVQGKVLRSWAMEQAQRIGGHFAKGDWVIRNPACGNRAVNRGEYTIGYSFGESKALAYLTGGALVPAAVPLAETVWNTLKAPTNPAYDKADNLHMAMAIIAVGDGFGAETADVLATLSALQDWPMYPLLHRVLHDSAQPGFCMTGAGINARARVMIDELPMDGEPACPTAGPLPHGFTTHNRFIRPKSQHYVGSPNCENNPLRYHGLDYMLLHNLYALATPGTWKGSPDADPCYVPPPSDLGEPLPGSDLGGPSDLGSIGEVGEGGPDGGSTPGDDGCACSISGHAAPASTIELLIALGLMLAGLGRMARTTR